jgi:membrane protease YdiL (CAAX protease family)
MFSMLRQHLTDFFHFLLAPRFCTPAPLRQGWGRWAIMTGAYLAGLVVIGIGVTLWQRAFHVPAPEAFGGYSARMLLVISVLIAPPCEEALFRGWLTGRPRALWLLLMAIAAAALLAAAAFKWHEIAVVFGLLALVIAAPVGWYRLRRLDTPAWFARRFGLWFYLSAIGFGLMHLSNYPRLSWALVPMVLPQVWAGMVFGYLRMRGGLWAGILAHGAGNAATLALALGLGH